MRLHTWLRAALRFGYLGLVALVFTHHASAAQVISVSDFQDNTTDSWTAQRIPASIAPKVVADGGPEGAGDAFLEITAQGGNGPGSKLAVFNSDISWTGNYLDLGANAIEVDMRNTSGGALSMRLVLFGNGSTNDRWTSTEAFDLPSDGQWHSASFSMAEDALSRVRGNSEYGAALGDVIRVMLRHDTGTPSAGGSSISANVGLDNIRLVKALDFNGDGQLDVADVNLMLTEIKAGSNAPEFDLNADSLVDRLDLNLLVTDPGNLNTYIGDADLSGEFGTSDLVAVFGAGEYEDGVMMNSTWETGDWNGDAEFGTGDLVAAFEDGGFEIGPRAASPIVPEPTTSFLSGAILLALGIRRRLFSRPT